MKPVLKQLVQAGDISRLSYYFAEFIVQQSAQRSNCDMDDLVALSAALVSEKNQQGDVCIVLDQYVNQPLFSTSVPVIGTMPKGISVAAWQQQLSESTCVGRPGDLAPLILEDNRLYLSRFWFYETQVARSILGRLNNPVPIDHQRFLPCLKRLFPGVDKTSDSAGQMIAVAMAASRRFSVISGGPGTGKTTTVVKLLSLLLSLEPDMRIQLAAPTGKAAMRLVESIQAQISHIFDGNPVAENHVKDDSIRSLMPTEASTIHRLLGYGNQKFRHSHDHRLQVDCIVVDEASMIDLTLMHHLLDALPLHTRVILLGDRDQLASVAAGNVLGDITGHGLSVGYSPSQVDFNDSIMTSSSVIEQSEQAEQAEQPIANAIALLKHSYRFKADSGIGQLAQLINQGSGQKAIDLLSGGGEHLYWQQDVGRTLSADTLDWIIGQYESVIRAESVDKALVAFEGIRILCAIRSGPFGVTEINRLITSRMLSKGWIMNGPHGDNGIHPFPNKQGLSNEGQDQNDHHKGEPILITQNDYELNLFNGDVGMIWPDALGNLRAYFRGSDNSLRELHLQSLAEHVTAWAMTVHKSQGSEFDTVLLVLPSDETSHSLSRELLYTGTTRTRKQLYVHASASAIMSSCQTITRRHSGLAQKLGWGDS
jgi:exodeoxyribonuclease V alpha subunit